MAEAPRATTARSAAQAPTRRPTMPPDSMAAAREKTDSQRHGNWAKPNSGTAFHSGLLTDSNGWSLNYYYSTLRLADVTGDGKADLCAMASNGVVCWPATTTRTGAGIHFGAAINGPAWTSANGWTHPQYYSTLRIGL